MTRVQFPRFEVDTDPNKWAGKAIEPRAQFQRWISPLMMSWMFEPREVDSTRHINEKRFLNWYGQYHHVSERITPGHVLRLSTDMRERPYRLRVRNHRYEWDHQAMPGTAYEVVLEGESDELGTFEELAAVFAKKIDSGRQRFVINNNGEWYEPDENSADIAASYLYAMGVLANATTPLTTEVA